MPNQRDVQRWLDTATTLLPEEITGEQQLAIEGLIGNPGMLAVLGLMLSARQGMYLQVANMPLSTDAGRYQAAVLQGQIKAIDMLPQTLLDLFPVAGTDETK
jgi:hypothetical protein